MKDGWKTRVAKLFARPFAIDADPRESESVRDEFTIRYLRPDVALVHTIGFGTLHNIATLILTKSVQEREIAALQRTAIQASPERQSNS